MSNIRPDQAFKNIKLSTYQCQQYGENSEKKNIYRTTLDK